MKVKLEPVQSVPLAEFPGRLDAISVEFVHPIGLFRQNPIAIEHRLGRLVQIHQSAHDAAVLIGQKTVLRGLCHLFVTQKCLLDVSRGQVEDDFVGGRGGHESCVVEPGDAVLLLQRDVNL